MTILLLLSAAVGHAQQLEFGFVSATNSSGPTITAQTATFYQNTGTSSTFSSYVPATTFSVSFSNQQYGSGTSSGIVFGSGIPVFGALNGVASPLANMFTSAPDISTAGTNISVTANYAYDISVFAGYQVGQLFTARNYYGDITVTFNRPVVNPVLHFNGFGGSIANGQAVLGFYSELELSTADSIAGRTLTRLSGSTHFVLDASNTKILNDATAKDSTSVTVYFKDQFNAGAGSVLVNTGAKGITSVTFRVYLKGDGGIGNPANIKWSASGNGANTPDGWLLSASLGMYAIKGTVFNDTNGLNDGTVNGSSINFSGLNAVLIDSLTGNVTAVTPVSSVDGTYTFAAVASGAYRVEITTAAATIGSVPPAVTLPGAYINTGENHGSGTGSDGSTNGILTQINVANADVTQVNFAIERLPQSAVHAEIIGLDSGGNVNTTVNRSWFQTGNVSSSPDTRDYDSGKVSFIRITAFPSRVTTITVNSIVYTSGGWPSGGVVIPYTDGIGPNWSISVNPLDSIGSVVIPFAAIDDAGKEDLTPGSVTLSYTAVLPLTLLDFAGVLKQNGAALRWHTISETNSNYFDVERSGDGKRYKTIGQQLSKAPGGNSANILEYDFTDVHAFEQMADVLHYRLKQVDYNGHYSYGPVITLLKEKTDGNANFRMWPNPVQGNNDLYVRVINPEDAYTATLSVADGTGKTVLSRDVLIDEGKNNIILPVSQLGAGLYYVQFMTFDTVIINKLIKTD